MGLLNKLKDLFMDEITEDDEIELEDENKELYSEPKDILPKVMRDTIEKDEAPLIDGKINLKEDFGVKEEKVEPPKKPETKFTFPIDFEEDYVPKRSNNVNVLEMEKEKEKERLKQKERELQKEKESKKVSSLYPKKEVNVKPKFKASPVISPVYGILDKNYKKDEVVEKEESSTSMKRASKKVDFESVRKKAFGNLTDEIKDNMLCENCELFKEVKRISSLKEDDLLYDMTVDDDKPVTLEKAYDNYEEFGVAYEPTSANKISSRSELRKNNEEIIVNHNEEKVVKAEKIEIKEEKLQEELPKRSDKKKESSKVDDDFFALIDSMYEERNEE